METLITIHSAVILSDSNDPHIMVSSNETHLLGMAINYVVNELNDGEELGMAINNWFDLNICGDYDWQVTYNQHYVLHGVGV